MDHAQQGVVAGPLAAGGGAWAHEQGGEVPVVELTRKRFRG